MLTGNLGVSSRTGQSVLELTVRSLGITLELAVWSILIAWVIGVLLGILASSRPGKLRDFIALLISLGGLSIPSFLLGTVLISITASAWGWNPNGLGFATIFENPGLHIQQMLMPSLVLGFLISAPIIRTTRAAILDISDQDFITQLRAKGVPQWQISNRHLLRNSSCRSSR